MFLNHPTKSEIKERDGVRDIRDWAGVYINPRRDGSKVFADLKVREAYFDLVKDIAILQPANVGNSINARVKVFQNDQGMESVSDIETLRSVDLVANAATTINLFESAMDENEIDEELNELTESVNEIVRGKFDVLMVEEGVLQSQIDNQTIKREIDNVVWLANDLINDVLRDSKLKVDEKKSKVIAIFDDLDTEVKKRLKGIRESINMKLTLEELKRDHADLVKSILDEFKQEEDYKSLGTKLQSANDTITDLKSKLDEYKTKADEKDQEINDLKSENSGLKLKLDEVEVSEKISAKKAVINEALTESKLPKEYRSEVFMETLMNLEEKVIMVEDEEVTVTVQEQVNKYIEDRKALVLKGSGKVKDSGDEFSDDVLEDLDEGENKTVEESKKDFMESLK